MGWRGAIRAIAAAQRAAEREALRRHRAHVRMAKQHAKLETLQLAASEVEEFESHVERITSVHRDCGERWDWRALANSPEPQAPVPSSRHESAAQRRLDAYQPSLVDRIFGRTGKKRAALEEAVVAGRRADAAENAQARRAFDAERTDRAEMRDLARRVLACDAAAFRDAVEELSPFSELSELGSHVYFEFRSDGTATAKLLVNGEDVVPGQVKTLLQSGKLSVKKMPQGRFHELYQDYVVGSAFRIARELFALLPLHTVHLTASARLLDPSSGHIVEQPILSVQMPRTTLESLRFETLDPSDALRHLNHRMDFKKTKGFQPIEPL